ncbi:hypothetical protein KAR91_68825, partial [Candidatus Pacearchaeota archaeon]|nr:hypothetical protein [Candidatus Pacearchaeota archaeon]
MDKVKKTYKAKIGLIYTCLYPKMLKIAVRHGYTLAAHGSMSRDMDLVAIPWREGAVAPIVLAKKLTKAIDGLLAIHMNGKTFEKKPHRRLGCVIHLPKVSGYAFSSAP